MKIVTVYWRDAHADNEIQKPEDVAAEHKPHMVYSVGFLFKKDKTGVTLVRDIDEDGALDGRLFIPRGMIEKISG